MLDCLSLGYATYIYDHSTLAHHDRGGVHPTTVEDFVYLAPIDQICHFLDADKQGSHLLLSATVIFLSISFISVKASVSVRT